MRLQFGEFDIRQRRDVRPFYGLCPLGHDLINSPAVREVDSVAADVGVMPVKNVDTTLRPRQHTEAHPGKIVSGDKIESVASDETGAFPRHVIRQDLVLMDVTHEEMIVILLGKSVGEVEAGAAVG